jgi:molybdenum cofactor cytidylyltransferase
MTVLAHLLTLWNSLGANQIAVVCASDSEPLARELDRLGATHQVINPHPERGMFSSIQAAAAWPGWHPALTHWAVVLGDQPQVPKATLRKLLDFAASHRSPVCQPSYRGRARHPVILARQPFSRLKSTPLATLREFLHQESPAPTLCALEDPALDLDLDTPADYAAAIKAYSPDRTPP